MNIMTLGGWMMWPLLVVSILALAVIVERFLLYAACPLPDDALRREMLKASGSGDLGVVAARMGGVPLLRPFAALLAGACLQRDAALRLPGNRFWSNWNVVWALGSHCPPGAPHGPAGDSQWYDYHFFPSCARRRRRGFVYAGRRHLAGFAEHGVWPEHRHFCSVFPGLFSWAAQERSRHAGRGGQCRSAAGCEQRPGSWPG